MFFRKVKVEKDPYCSCCQVAYKRRPDDRFAHLCIGCAKEPREKARRIAVVTDYATANWEKLEKAALAYQAKQAKASATVHGNRIYGNRIYGNRIVVTEAGGGGCSWTYY
jgi:hypothetical protein